MKRQNEVVKPAHPVTALRASGTLIQHTARVGGMCDVCRPAAALPRVRCGVVCSAVCAQCGSLLWCTVVCCSTLCVCSLLCVWCGVRVVCGVWCVVCAVCDVRCAMCGVQCAVMCCSVCDGYVYFSEHTIEWKDGRSENWSVNLMACRKIKEWRFVQPSEDVDEFLK